MHQAVVRRKEVHRLRTPIPGQRAQRATLAVASTFSLMFAVAVLSGKGKGMGGRVEGADQGRGDMVQMTHLFGLEREIDDTRSRADGCPWLVNAKERDIVDDDKRLASWPCIIRVRVRVLCVQRLKRLASSL